MKVLFIFLLACLNAHAIELEVTGNTKTHLDVIKVEIADLLQKKQWDESDLAEAKRRIWNLRVFSEVEIKLNEEKVSLTVEERWTLLPIAKFVGGGGSTYYAVGAFDVNWFGTNTEVGAQYESLNNRPAGVVWLRKPQFLKDRNLRLGLDIWNINRVRFLFNRDGTDNGAFTLNRNRYNAFIDKRWDNDFYRIGFQYDFHQDEISEFGLSDENLAQNANNNFAPDEQSLNRWHTLFYSIGRINFQNYLVDGTQLSVRHSLVAADNDFLTENQVRFRYYKLFKNHHNFAWQFLLRGNNLRNIQYLQYTGGLSEVRGYRDGQFFAETAWQNNLEYRFDVFESPWVVLQAVTFTDQAKEGKTLGALLESQDEIMLSTGFGVRFISPKIFRFTGRLDYAQTHTRSQDRGISFGIQQFF